jgi:hypothetical protein
MRANRRGTLVLIAARSRSQALFYMFAAERVVRALDCDQRRIAVMDASRNCLKFSRVADRGKSASIARSLGIDSTRSFILRLSNYLATLRLTNLA